MTGDIFTAPDAERTFLSVDGADAERFLQDLLTNDVRPAAANRGVYAALLSPQGKLLADLILWRPTPERFVLDVAACFAADLEKRLGLYKLRAAVRITRETGLGLRHFWRADGDGLETPSTAATKALIAAGPDPRDGRLGLRVISADPAAAVAEVETAAPALDGAREAPLEAWEQLRIARGVPASGLDLRAGDAYPLEYGFERLGGVDFKKGCFVGQEIVARMKHKAELKRGLFRVALDGAAPPAGTEIISDGKPAGSMGSAHGETGLALLRFDRASGALEAGGRRLVCVERIEAAT